MKRIGIAASKISKGNTFLYNGYVVLISLLIALALFIAAGSVVIFALSMIRYIGNEVMGLEFESSWQSILGVCMVSLTVVMTLFTLMAISINLRFPKIKR